MTIFFRNHAEWAARVNMMMLFLMYYGHVFRCYDFGIDAWSFAGPFAHYRIVQIRRFEMVDFRWSWSVYFHMWYFCIIFDSFVSLDVRMSPCMHDSLNLCACFSLIWLISVCWTWASSKTWRRFSMRWTRKCGRSNQYAQSFRKKYLYTHRSKFCRYLFDLSPFLIACISVITLSTLNFFSNLIISFVSSKHTHKTKTRSWFQRRFEAAFASSPISCCKYARPTYTYILSWIKWLCSLLYQAWKNIRLCDYFM
jgi:L-lactate permease